MERLKTFFDDLEENLLCGILALMVVIIFVQVVMRYVFSNSLSWSEELARYLFIWLTWLGTGYAFRNNHHLRIEFLVDRLPERVRYFLEFLILSLWLGFSVFLVYKGWIVTSLIWTRGQLSAAMQIPMALAYGAVPVGCLLMAVRLFFKLTGGFIDRKYEGKEKR